MNNTVVACSVKISDVKSINEIPGYWTNKDCVDLLQIMEVSDVEGSSFAELQELLEMAISDREPHESAEVLLRYKLADRLKNGQIENLSHVMIEDNEAEENPDIALHYPLFNINQLLYKSYNGQFTNGKATRIEFELDLKRDEEMPVTREFVLKAISKGLSENNLVIRLFEDQINGQAKFVDAEHIIWELHKQGQGEYAIITSDYWINKEDFVAYEFETSVKPYTAKEA